MGTAVWGAVPPQKAEAQLAGQPVDIEAVGISDGTSIAIAIDDTAANTAALVPTNAVTALSTAGSFNIMNVLNGIAVGIARAAIQAITRSIVAWINSGFQGSPAFVTNLQAYLLAVSDHIAGTLIAQLAGSDFICSPFKLQLANLLHNQYYGNQFLGKCSLIGIVNNLQNFANSPFGGSGGWPGWISMVSQPQNNFYGAYYAANAELSLQLQNARGQKMTLLDWGHGFLSWCGSGSGTNGNLVNLGDNQEFGKDLNQVGLKASAAYNAQTCTNKDGTSGTIQTPGSVIENELEFQLGTGVRQLELTQSINEIVSALMQQLIVQALGATGLTGLSSPNYGGGGGSFLDQLGSATTTATSTLQSQAQSLMSTITTDKKTYTTYEENWQTIAGAGQGAAAALANLATQCPADSASATQTLAETVQPVLASASTAIGNATTTLASLDALAVRVAAADASIESLAQVSTDYQNLKSAPTTPTIPEIAQALYDATDSGSSTPPSLFTQMTGIASTSEAAATECN